MILPAFGASIDEMQLLEEKGPGYPKFSLIMSGDHLSSKYFMNGTPSTPAYMNICVLDRLFLPSPLARPQSQKPKFLLSGISVWHPGERCILLRTSRNATKGSPKADSSSD